MCNNKGAKTDRLVSMERGDCMTASRCLLMGVALPNIRQWMPLHGSCTVGKWADGLP